MNIPFQEDQKVTFFLPFSKIISILPLDEDKVFVLHHNYEFAVFVLRRPKCQILGMGSLPHLSCQFKVYSKCEIIFLKDNEIFIYNWLEKEYRANLKLPKSEIYHQTFQYYLADSVIVFWKSSQLLHEYHSIAYEIDLYDRQGLNRIKKYKQNMKQPCSFSYCFNQIVAFEIMGFRLQIMFLESQAVQQIQSIYKLIFVESEIVDGNLVLAYTHSEIQKGQQISFRIRQNHIQKIFQQMRDPGLIRMSDRVHFQLPDLFESKKIAGVNLILKVRFSLASKYSCLIGKLIADESQDTLLRQILQLLGQV